MSETRLHRSHLLPHLLYVSLLAIIAGCSAPAQAPKAQGFAFWPDAPDAPHVQFLASFTRGADIRPRRDKFQDMVYGKETENDLPIVKPYGVAMWNGRIYVCDLRGSGMTVLDLRARQTRIMGAGGQGTIQRPSDVKVAPDGTKYVADLGRSAIVVFDAEERYSRLFPIKDGTPVGLAVHGNELYVCDMQGQHVKVLDRFSGKLLRTIGERGMEDGQFIRPISAAVDAQGNLFVVDFMKCRVQKFSPDGKFLMGFGQKGQRPGDFDKPKHIAISASNIIYVVDAAYNNVQMFDEEGKPMMFFGSYGGHPGSMDLPAGICISEGDVDLFKDRVHPAFRADRLVIVTNQFGMNRLAVYAEGELLAGKTVEDLTFSRAKIEPGTSPENAATQPSTQPADDEIVPAGQ